MIKMFEQTIDFCLSNLNRSIGTGIELWYQQKDLVDLNRNLPYFKPFPCEQCDRFYHFFKQLFTIQKLFLRY